MCRWCHDNMLYWPYVGDAESGKCLNCSILLIRVDRMPYVTQFEIRKEPPGRHLVCFIYDEAKKIICYRCCCHNVYFFMILVPPYFFLIITKILALFDAGVVHTSYALLWYSKMPLYNSNIHIILHLNDDCIKNHSHTKLESQCNNRGEG